MICSFSTTYHKKHSYILDFISYFVPQEYDHQVKQYMEKVEDMSMLTHSLSTVPRVLQDCSALISQHNAECKAHSFMQENTTTNIPNCLSLDGMEQLQVLGCSQSTNKVNPVPTPRPNLVHMLLRCSDTGQTLNNLQLYTEGTNICDVILNTVIVY